MIEPRAHAGERIRILHVANPEPSSMWRDIGAAYDILVPELIFERDYSREYGPGSIEIVQRAQNPGEERPNTALEAPQQTKPAVDE